MPGIAKQSKATVAQRCDALRCLVLRGSARRSGVMQSKATKAMLCVAMYSDALRGQAKLPLRCVACLAMQSSAERGLAKQSFKIKLRRLL